MGKVINCEDHLGNKFNSKAEMTKFYGTTTKRLNARLANGHTLEEALTMPIKSNSGLSQTDHLGNRFKSTTEMCSFYGIKRKSYERRIERGWSKEAALTTPVAQYSNVLYDHLGNEYPSKAALCRAYNIGTTTFDMRMQLNWSLEEALTGKVYYDHLGNEFSSTKEMCDYYNISSELYQDRMTKGWTMEKALTEPKQDLSVYDHLGNKYTTQGEMCKAYDISFEVYLARLNKLGWSLEDALTISVDEHDSYYEILTKKYLQRKNIDFKFQDTSHNCVSSGGKRSRFDFSIPDVGLIEVDGEGHFRPISNWNFEKAVRDDTLKTAYCEEHNIPLLRIRYDQMQDGTYADLIADFIENPAAYITTHNRLSEAEYYAERTENLSVASV